MQNFADVIISHVIRLGIAEPTQRTTKSESDPARFSSQILSSLTNNASLDTIEIYVVTRYDICLYVI